MGHYFNLASESEFAHVEMAVYNLWKMRRARNAAAVAINKATGALRLAYYQRQHARLLELLEMIPHSPYAAYREIRQTTQGVRWMLQMLERLGRTLEATGRLDAGHMEELIYLFGLNPTDLCLDRNVARLLFDLLALEYGRGTLTTAAAAELLAEFKPASMTALDFQAYLEPYVAGMLTVVGARKYVARAIAKMHQEVTDALKRLKDHDEQQIARDITEAKDDITDAGRRHQQNEGRAETGHFRSLRGLYAVQDVRRKFGAGDPDEAGEQPLLEDAAASPAQDRPAAPAAGPDPAAEKPQENDPTVPQTNGTAKGCNEEAAQPDPTGDSAEPFGLTLMEALMAKHWWPSANHPLRE
jgi:hypothetical protein